MSNIFLQASGSTYLSYWLAGGLFLLAASLLYLMFFAPKPADPEEKLDPRSNTVNDSNYNISHVGIDQHRVEGMSPQEAREVVEGLKESKTIPSRDEFFGLRKAMRQDKNAK